MSSLRVLIADDEQPFREFVSYNLRARGFEVLEAANGSQALALWEHYNPDLLILDIVLPRIDGLEVCRRVREHSSVPIVVVTALDTDSEKHIAAEFGADEYLTKPFGVEALLNAVQAALRRHTASEE